MNRIYITYAQERIGKGDIYDIGEQLPANIEFMLESQSDFDADKRQPHTHILDEYNPNEEREEFEIIEPYSPAKNKQSFDGYYRRLEDINTDYLESFLGNTVYNLFRRKGSGGKLYFESIHRVQPTLISQSDDDDFTELADLQLTRPEGEIPEKVKAKAIERLPYVMKRLNNLSILCGIHMLSYIASYVNAKKANDLKNAYGSTKTLKANDVIALGAYKYDRWGRVGTRIGVENRNQKAMNMFNWLAGYSREFSSYREDYLNFVYYCNLLNISISTEDFLQYDTARLLSMSCTVVTPNSQYSKLIYDAIKDSGILEKQESIDDYITETIETLKELSVYNQDIKRAAETNDPSINKLIFECGVSMDIYYNAVLNRTKEFRSDKDYTWRNGILHYKDNPVVLPTSIIDKEMFRVPYFIISELGYIVQLSGDTPLYMIPVNAAKDSIWATYVNKTSTYSIQWVVFT